jgi:hypothetical protein
MSAAPKMDAEKLYKVEWAPETGCNTSDDVLLAQVAANIRRGLPQVQPHQVQPNKALLVCGGPSLAMTEKELRDAQWAGGKVIAVNGAYQWCIDRNIKPSCAVMLDARDFNARFLKTPVPGCRYLLASQCHGDTFDMCAGRDALIWHAASAGDKEVDLLKEFYFGQTHVVTLGTSVGVRAISLLRMLGFYDFEIFGLDSCWLDDKHHAYEQAENRDKRVATWLRPKDRDDKAIRFECAPWHMKQLEDFIQLVRERGNLFRLHVHGPGLIASMLRTGAEIHTEETSPGG